MQIIHHINQLKNLSDREFNNATALPPNNLLRRVDDCVMNTLFSGALSFESRGSPPELFLRLSLRVLRNIVYSGYSPVRLATFAIFHPLRTLQALPFYLMRLSLAIFSLDSLLAMAGSSVGGAMAIAITLGGAPPPILLPAFFAGMGIALFKHIKNNKPTSFLELLEFFLTGLVFGLGSAWFMRRRMESGLEKAKQQLSKTVRLPSGATGFLNNQNQAIFQCSDYASVGEFLNKNPELAASFREHFHYSHQSYTSRYRYQAYYEPSHVLVAENGNVFVTGRYLIDSNQNSRTHLIWTIKNTANALPSQEIQGAAVTSLGIGAAAFPASGRQPPVQSQWAARERPIRAARPVWANDWQLRDGDRPGHRDRLGWHPLRPL